MPGLSKSRIIAHRLCPRRLWLQTNRPELAEVTPEMQAGFDVGHTVGEIACAQYPEGKMLPDDLREALGETSRLIEGESLPLFEATFQHEGVLCRADVLLPTQKGRKKVWRMVEVKSATKVKDYYREDLAIQTWVIRNSGLPLTEVALAHVDTGFVYPGGGDYSGMLKEVDLTEEMEALVEEVPRWIEDAQATLRKRKEPGIAPGKQCTSPYACSFHEHCNPPPNEAYPVELLPSKHAGTLAAELRAEGYGDLRKVPAERIPAHPVLKRVYDATKRARPMVDPEARRIVSGLGYPRYFLDFETVNPAIPAWAGTRPYQIIPFQWSCHIENRAGELKHVAFLAQGDVDPREAFIQQLLKVLRKQGPILVYSPYESTCLKGIAADFPQYADEINAVLARIVDLYPVCKEYYYHRDQFGSWSLKAVLPTVAPDLAYDDLAVANGGMAMEAWYEIMQPETEASRRTELRQALLDYCERDTLALVRLAHFFEGK